MHHTIKEKAILIIAYQDEITVVEAREYYEANYDRDHIDHPFGNYTMCDGCRVNHAVQLSEIINSE